MSDNGNSGIFQTAAGGFGVRYKGKSLVARLPRKMNQIRREISTEIRMVCKKGKRIFFVIEEPSVCG